MISDINEKWLRGVVHRAAQHGHIFARKLCPGGPDCLEKQFWGQRCSPWFFRGPFFSTDVRSPRNILKNQYPRVFVWILRGIMYYLEEMADRNDRKDRCPDHRSDTSLTGIMTRSADMNSMNDMNDNWADIDAANTTSRRAIPLCGLIVGMIVSDTCCRCLWGLLECFVIWCYLVVSATMLHVRTDWEYGIRFDDLRSWEARNALWNSDGKVNIIICIKEGTFPFNRCYNRLDIAKNMCFLRNNGSFHGDMTY